MAWFQPKSPAARGLSLRLRWGEQLLTEVMLHPGAASSFKVGSEKGVDFVMGDRQLGAPAFVAATGDVRGFQVRFRSGMRGELCAGDARWPLQALIDSGRAQRDGDAWAVALDPENSARVDLGGVVLEARLRPAPKAVRVPLSETLDYTVLNTFLALFFLAALFVISAGNREAEGDALADGLNGDPARAARLLIKPREEKTDPFVEALRTQKAPGTPEHSGPAGSAGRIDAPVRAGRMAPKGRPDEKGQARTMAESIFGSSGTAGVLGPTGTGGEWQVAFGNVVGPVVGDARGMGGLSLRGPGSGGGGTGERIGIGGITTRGRGGGGDDYGTGVPGLHKAKGPDFRFEPSDPTITGSLDKELIRQVIRRNVNQIRYCYEQALTRSPTLSGKVSVKFVISSSGAVASAQVAQSSAESLPLESCVAGRVRTWQFPQPKGGGVVQVTYPFVFARAGG